uniref:F-box domain-containing protein n=1 Tax=Strongyloides papillosus TaxID=174720 RepID=A0A0N5BTI3_STREA
MKCDFEKEKIERRMFFYTDNQKVSITYGDGYDKASGFPELGNLEIVEDSDSKDLRNRSRTFFGETIPNSNRVTYCFGLLVGKWREEDHVAAMKKPADILDLNCATRKMSKISSCKVLDALSHMKHENITRISLPLNCFRCHSYKHSTINGNIFNGFPNLTELSLTCHSSDRNYYGLIRQWNTFERVVQQFSTTKNPTIFLKSLQYDDAMHINELNEIISIITKYNVKAKIKIEIDCPRYEGQCENCTGTVGFFSSIKEYITYVFSTIENHRQLLHNIGILKTFENLSTLNLKFSLYDITYKFIPPFNQRLSGFGLKKLNNLENVKLNYLGNINDRHSNVLDSFYQFFEFIRSMMPKSVEVLKLENVPDMDDATAKMTTEYMPNIKLLKIKCLTYKESDGLDNFTKLDCLFSSEYCPIKIPKTLKLLAFEHKKWKVRSDDIIFTDNIIKSYYEKFTKRITDGKNRYILFSDVCNWHLYKCAIQKYFCRGF